MPSERLQKIIAAARIASRRTAEKMITSGLVGVNGKTVTELGSRHSERLLAGIIDSGTRMSRSLCRQ